MRELRRLPPAVVLWMLLAVAVATALLVLCANSATGTPHQLTGPPGSGLSRAIVVTRAR